VDGAKENKGGKKCEELPRFVSNKKKHMRGRGRETRSTHGRHGGRSGHAVGENLDKIKHDSGDFTTFFFSNFPNGFGELDMFKIIQKWARVKEVFIARKLNKRGRRFGFVRFFEVGNAARLEKELDQIYIGNVKLFVNIPRYRRLDPITSRGASF